MDKFRNKYRIPSTRLQSWDYSSSGMYFITICTENRGCFFGKIDNGEMVLSENGKIANNLLLEIQNQFPFANVDEFIVMPNHIHVIIIIDTTKTVETRFIASPNNPEEIAPPNNPEEIASPNNPEEIASPNNPEEIASPNNPEEIASPNNPEKIASSNKKVSEDIKGGITGNKNPMINQSISTIIRWYKGRVTFEIRKNDTVFGWQSRFHDHIIRSFDSYHRIADYIKTNPRRWEEDKFYK